MRDSNVRVVGALHRPAEVVPVDQPGRGLSMGAEQFLFGHPNWIRLPRSTPAMPVSRRRRCGCYR